MTVMVVLHMIWSFGSMLVVQAAHHWHNVIGVLAFVIAAYNHFRHNRLSKQFAAEFGPKPAKSKSKSKKRPVAKSKKRK